MLARDGAIRPTSTSSTADLARSPASDDSARRAATYRAFFALMVVYLVGQAVTVQANQYRVTGVLDFAVFGAVFVNAPGTILGANLVFRRERQVLLAEYSTWSRLGQRAVSLVLFTLVVALMAVVVPLVLSPLVGPLLSPGAWMRPAIYVNVATNAPFSFAVAWIVARGTVMYETAWRAQRAEADQRLARAREAGLRTAMELRMLRTYMQPHFLFNTLNVIAALTDDRPKEARRALVTTADLLRSTLIEDPDAEDITTLRDELRVVHHYLAIEQLRMVDRLRVVESIEPSTLVVELPRFALQTLVENAVRHGLFPSPSGGMLTITTTRTMSVLTITVADTGIGCQRADLESGNGFGLKALAARLADVYGTRSRLAFETAPGQGFSATVEVPLTTDAP